jgi:PadR family transcriptional regulator, regulatory protein PadR
MPPPSLGEFEQIVMLAVLRLGDDAYGVPIRQEIVGCTGRDASPGAIYTTLERLEDKGLVRSRFGDPTPERGGRAKRYFRLTVPGRQALVRAQQSYQRLLDGVTLPGVSRA